jgi:uncharacterized protein (DUF362 family)
VAILEADSYARSLEEKITDGLRLFALNLRDKTLLLKPNLVEYIPGAEVNANPLLVDAAAGAFLALGAKTVVVAEGPGNQRDTYLVIAQTGFESQLRDRKLSFVDLNRDDVRQVKVTTPFTGLDSLWMPQSILAADLVVSMPKVKTHHWAGVTLGLKNIFGTIPGSVYGWPKNVLHWKGNRPEHPRNQQHYTHFVIADGIVGMEDNGPLQGTARDLGESSCRMIRWQPTSPARGSWDSTPIASLTWRRPLSFWAMAMCSASLGEGYRKPCVRFRFCPSSLI